MSKRGARAVLPPIFAALLLAGPVIGLQCYSCSLNAGTNDWNCLEDPDRSSSAPFIECSSKQNCVVIRNEYALTGRLFDFLRTCEEGLPFNTTVTSKHYITHYYGCSTDKCNTGDGTPASWSGGGGGGGNGGGGGSPPTVALVPGKGSSASTAVAELAAIIIGAAVASVGN